MDPLSELGTYTRGTLPHTPRKKVDTDESRRQHNSYQHTPKRALTLTWPLAKHTKLKKPPNGSFSPGSVHPLRSNIINDDVLRSYEMEIHY